MEQEGHVVDCHFTRSKVKGLNTFRKMSVRVRTVVVLCAVTRESLPNQPIILSARKNISRKTEDKARPKTRGRGVALESLLLFHKRVYSSLSSAPPPPHIHLYSCRTTSSSPSASRRCSRPTSCTEILSGTRAASPPPERPTCSERLRTRTADIRSSRAMLCTWLTGE